MGYMSLTEIFTSQSTYVLIMAFTIIPLLIGSFASQNSVSTISDFFLYNRKMGTTISFFTVYATWWSSFAFLGSISYFYRLGPLYWTGMAWNILFGVLYMIYGKKISFLCKEKGYVTSLDYFKDVYNSPILNVILAIIMIVFTTLYLQIQLFGGAIIISIATNNMVSWQLCALVFYSIMIIYLWSGGMRAVAWADVLYGVLTFTGMIFSGFYLASKVGGVEMLFSRLIIEHPSHLILPKSSNPNGAAMWISMFLILPLGALMGPQMWLRMNATEKTKTFAIMPFLISIATIAYLGSMLSGNVALLLSPEEISSADHILPLLLQEYAPPLITAGVLCCGAAACLSTANSEIHAISALITLNYYKPICNPKGSEKQIVFVAKIVIVLYSVFAYFSLILTSSMESIVDSGITSLAGLAQIVVPLTGALCWKRANKIGAIFGLLVGISLTIFPQLLKDMPFPLHTGVIGLIANALVFILCGLIVQKK